MTEQKVSASGGTMRRLDGPVVDPGDVDLSVLEPSTLPDGMI